MGAAGGLRCKEVVQYLAYLSSVTLSRQGARTVRSHARM